jgi:hypothetical protein
MKQLLGSIFGQNIYAELDENIPETERDAITKNINKWFESADLALRLKTYNEELSKFEKQYLKNERTFFSKETLIETIGKNLPFKSNKI